MKLIDIIQLGEDQTIPQLHQHIRQGFPHTKKRQHATHEVSITKLRYVPVLDNNVLKIDGATRSSNGNNHTQAMEIRGVTFQSANSGNVVQVSDVNGNSHFVTPAPLNTSTVGVFCDCEDYQMRFAIFNIQQNCHIGPPPEPYIRKTTTRPPANPNNVPGMCKHLITIANDLQAKRILF